MRDTTLAKKKELILAGESAMARQLGLRVLDKPQPRVWMIFMPIIFVFYFQKLKEFEYSLRDFSANHLIPRRLALEAALGAEQERGEIDIEQLVHQAGGKPKNHALYTAWMTVLISHFRLLLTTRGDSYPTLLRAGYHDKSNYLAFCRRLGAAEIAFNLTLLPNLEGNNSDLHRVAEAMAEELDKLRAQEAAKVFA